MIDLAVWAIYLFNQLQLGPSLLCQAGQCAIDLALICGPKVLDRRIERLLEVVACVRLVA